MWPFRRRRECRWCCGDGDSVDLDDLGALVDTNPTKSYLNLLLLEMADRGESERILRQSMPLPWPAHFDHEELPPFSPVVNRLKIMSGLDPVVYHEPREGKIEMSIGGQGVILHTRFDDTSQDRSVHLRLKRLD